MLFSDRKNLLSLYNAVNHSSYEREEDLKVNTIENAVYLGVHNDVSFIICNFLNMYEHQSTVNPNIPLRMLFYVTRLLSEEVSEERLFSRKRISIPEPKFIVFYNGNEQQPECREFRLSELWGNKEAVPDLELRVVQLNINPGNNEELKNTCRTLRDYMAFVESVRDYFNETGSLEEAVSRSIDWCITNDILQEFLVKHQWEVTELFLDGYDEEKVRRVLEQDARELGFEEGREEGIKKGLEEGRAEGRAEGYLQLLIAQICRKVSIGQSLERIREDLGNDLPEVESLYNLALESGPEADQEEILKNYRELAEREQQNGMDTGL